MDNRLKQLWNYLFPSDNGQAITLTREPWMNASPAQVILWNYVMNRFHPATITPIYYLGITAGCEFYSYKPNTYYLALEIGALNQCPSMISPELDFHGVGGFEFLGILGGGFPYWDATDAVCKSLTRVQTMENVWFSYVSGSSYSYMKFSGYRLENCII